MGPSENIFRFKRFNVVNERSAMKVNTDGVLLGALMTVRPSDRRLLDIGTGTGTIALMAAQRLAESGLADGRSAMLMCESGQNESVHIDAIDIDAPSVEEAAANFEASAWKGCLSAHHSSLGDFARKSDAGYDLIFSNPPYFDCSLQAPQERRNAARHTAKGLSYREILDFAAERLTRDGRVALVLPSDTENDLTRHARMCGLHLHRITRIRTVPRKAPSRIIAEFARERASAPDATLLTIRDGGQYTPEYLELMHDFYLFA